MVSSTRRTAGCGPACPVVWEGRTGDRLPYPDYVSFYRHLYPLLPQRPRLVMRAHSDARDEATSVVKFAREKRNHTSS
jgi:hypothetical protein